MRSAKLDTPDDLPAGVPDSASNSCAYVKRRCFV